MAFLIRNANPFLCLRPLMISYRKFWALLSARGISAKELRDTYGISARSIRALRQNNYVRTSLLDKLCRILNCSVSELLEQEEEDDELLRFIQVIRKKEHPPH